MQKEVNLGQTYQHYSGKHYRVIGVGRHSETLEELVVYQGLYDCPSFGKNPIWIRPKTMFFDEVNIDGIQTPRFKLIQSTSHSI